MIRETMMSPDPVPSPKADEHWLDDDRDVEPRARDDLVSHMMEIRGLSRPDAEQFVDDRGPEHAERLIQQRWSS